jgi:hypothetical protein
MLKTSNSTPIMINRLPGPFTSSHATRDVAPTSQNRQRTAAGGLKNNLAGRAPAPQQSYTDGQRTEQATPSG